MTDRKLFETVTRIDTNVAHLLAADDDKEKRLRSLEKWKWANFGSAVIAVLLAKLGLPLPR